VTSSHGGYTRRHALKALGALGALGAGSVGTVAQVERLQAVLQTVAHAP